MTAQPIEFRNLPAGVRQIIAGVCQARDVGIAELWEGSRFRAVVEARREVAALLREYGLSLPQIGRYLHVHHTSIHYALSRRRETIAAEESARRAAAMAQIIPCPDFSGEWAI